MKRSKVKKIILANRVKSSMGSQICYLCDAIKQTHKNYNLSSLLITVSQWDTKGSSKIRRSIQNLKCFVCNYKSKYFNEWKAHIMSNGHMSMCHTLDNVCSYFCKACKTLFYGSEMCISQHQKNVHGGQSNLSGVSILMSELMNCLDIYSKHVYFCNMCKIVSETPIHTSGKHFNNQKLYDCKYCNTTFLCNAEELDFHEASVEHLTFKCIYSIKEAIEVNRLKIQKRDQVTKTTHNLQTKVKQLELPLIILDRFQKTSESMAKCNFCNVLICWNTQRIAEHVNICLNKGNMISGNMHENLITAYDCELCNFKTNSFFSYKLHVISPIHLNNSHTSGDLYSYFCTICNLYIYASKIQINDHLKRKHKTKITDLPLLSKVLKDNYKYISNHPGSDFIDYYSDQQFCEKDFYPIQCTVCKISFCTSNYEYNLHEISSEHIILKYFTTTNPALVMKHNYGYEKVQTTSTINTNLIINNEALNNKCLSSTKTDSSNPEKNSGNKDHTDIKKRKLPMNSTISENNKLLINCSDGKSHSEISSTNTNQNTQQNVHFSDDNDDNGVKIAYLKSTAGILFAEHTPKVLHYADVTTSLDDLRQTNIIKKQKTFQSDTQSNITTPYKQMHPTDTDQLYGQYVIERLKNIHNKSLKNNIKIEIDALLCTYT